MSAKSSAEVNPLAQIDHLQSINNRINALIGASYDMFEELFDAGTSLPSSVNAVSLPITSAADRGMILLGLAKDLIEQSQDGLTKEYAALCSAGLTRVEARV